MKLLKLSVWIFLVSLIYPFSSQAGIRDEESEVDSRPTSNETSSESSLSSDSSLEELEAAKEALKTSDEEFQPKQKPQQKKRILKSEAFVVGPEWEFDGFVAGGLDQQIKSMYVVNDTLYLNIGYSDGIKSGDRLTVYRRGERIRDPQTGRNTGFEVRKVAVAEVTDKVSDDNSSARILKSYEAVEIGDLVRRD